MRRQFDAQIRQVGNSFVVTIPANTVQRFKLKGKWLTVTISTKRG